jgi:hypothetical protein
MAIEYALTRADVACLEACVLRLRPGWLASKVAVSRLTSRASTSLSMAVTPLARAGDDEEVVASWGNITTILETAAERQCDVIVLGTDQGLTWPRLWSRHLLKTLMTTTALPLLVVNRLMTHRL